MKEKKSNRPRILDNVLPDLNVFFDHQIPTDLKAKYVYEVPLVLLLLLFKITHTHKHTYSFTTK